MKNEFVLKFITSKKEVNNEINDISSSKLYGKREPISLNQMSQSIDKTKGMYSTSARNNLYLTNTCSDKQFNDNKNVMPIKLKLSETNSSKLLERNSLKLKNNFESKTNLKKGILNKELQKAKNYQHEYIIDSRKKYNDHLTRLLIMKSNNKKSEQIEMKDNISDIDINQSQQVQNNLIEHANIQFEITGKFQSQYDDFTYSKQDDLIKNDNEQLQEESNEVGYSQEIFNNNKYKNLLPTPSRISKNKNLISQDILNLKKLIKLKSIDLVTPASKGFINNKYRNIITNYNIEKEN